MEPKVPPTMRELASAASTVLIRGLECRRCGCRDFRVDTTRKSANVIVRYRVCRHCGLHRTTLES